MNELLEKYILDHIETEPQHLCEMYREAHIKLLHPRMLSGHLQGRVLKMLCRMIRPKNVLEIGTFTGYSALSIAEALQEDAQLHTLEINDEMEDFIRKYIDSSAYTDKIHLHIGDALQIVPAFEDNFFDLVFIDADKRNYWEYYEAVFNKVKKGGFILADNTLWGGKVIAKIDENDGQTRGILTFNEKLQNDHRVEKVILPLRDGITIIYKKQQWNQIDKKK